MKKPPIVIVGMHRSGTSMLTRVMCDLGAFMGIDKSENDESRFFQDLDRWILFQAGAAWDLPDALEYIDPRFVDRCAQIIDERMSSPWRMHYLGLRRFFQNRSISDQKSDWGWKDPRTTILLPIYRELFPNAKILHVHRNPIDVAVSLRNREIQKKAEDKRTLSEKWKLKFLVYQRIVNHSFIVEDLGRGVDLWQYYTEKALAADSLFEQTLHIRYEDLLTEPKRIIEQVLEFLGIAPRADVIDDAVRELNPDRKFAFKKVPELCEFYETIRNRPLLSQLRYDSII